MDIILIILVDNMVVRMVKLIYLFEGFSVGTLVLMLEPKWQVLK